MSGEPICPCDCFVFPTAIANLSGLSSIAYRVGDFTAFRHALLLARPNEVELANWRPGAEGDLAVQMVEWWAYIADILTFYNERIANQNYLGTADLPESVNRLIRLLGYRPRPGIGATGKVAALLSKPAPLVLPSGFQIQSKPGPGQQPQIFEVDADTTIGPIDAVPVDPAPDASVLRPDAAGNPSCLLAGAVSGIKADDELLFLARGWSGTDANWKLATVRAVTPEKDAHGKTNTRVAFAAAPALPSDAEVGGYRLLKSGQFARPWQGAAAAITLQSESVDLDSVVRTIKTGDPVLFEIPGGTTPPQLVSVTSYTEAIWYANAPDQAHPDKAPASPVPAIAILHSRIGFQPAQSANWDLGQLTVRHGWQDVGQLLASPASILDTASPTLIATPPALLPPGKAAVMIEGANDSGIKASASVAGTPATMQLDQLPDVPVALTAPLRALYGLLPVSRGKTVASEILGSGDATQAGQDFVLKKAPLTYLLGASVSGDNYCSTLRVWVDGVQWKEVASFYGQGADARIFVTREDEQNQTHVMFGDGVNGARLPSGVNNVVASYRYGSGAAAPTAGTLTNVLHPRPNLKAIRNPVPVGGGADPDPPEQIRRYAPRSVLTFGRAISADDYETIAAQAPGVARARCYWTWDADEQRAMVTIYVGDDASAVANAQTAIALSDDPNRPVAVKLATAVPVQVSLTLRIDARYPPDAVIAAASAALLDPARGLLGAAAPIGQTIFDSQIYDACLRVPGAVAVHGLAFRIQVLGPWPWGYFVFARTFTEVSFADDPYEKHFPGIGAYFVLSADNLTISYEVAGDDQR